MEKIYIDYDVDKALNEEIKNVICTEINQINLDLFAEAFYDIYLK